MASSVSVLVLDVTILGIPVMCAAVMAFRQLVTTLCMALGSTNVESACLLIRHVTIEQIAVPTAAPAVSVSLAGIPATSLK